MAASYFFTNASISSATALSTSPSVPLIDFSLSTAVRILSRPFFEASTRSAEKLSGLL